MASKRKKKDEEDTDDDKISKKDKKLLQYLENPNTNTILIFTVYGKPASKKKIVKIIKDRYSYIEIADFKPAELISRADNLLKEDGYKASKEVLQYIISNCLNNYDLIVNEIDKIKLYYSIKSSRCGKTHFTVKLSVTVQSAKVFILKTTFSTVLRALFFPKH